MSDKYEDKESLACKVDWEGGILESIFYYGISAHELPVGTPPEIVLAWDAVESVQWELDKIEEWLYS